MGSKDISHQIERPGLLGRAGRWSEQDNWLVLLSAYGGHRLIILTSNPIWVRTIRQGREPSTDTISVRIQRNELSCLWFYCQKWWYPIKWALFLLLWAHCQNTFSSLFYSLREPDAWYPANESGLFPFQISSQSRTLHISPLFSSALWV